ncbi:MAG: flagellar biosynthetic protein FliO [Myxococcales bacterium]|nr:flagellar biosynthetic protein FliO [Myxococcales bacterium]
MGMLAASIVFGVMGLAAAWFLKRSRKLDWLSSGGQDLSIQDSLWVGKGQRLLVVNVAGRRYLLGSTTNGLDTLAELDEAPPTGPSVSEPAVREPSFRDLVGRAMIEKNDNEQRSQRRHVLDGLRSL